MTRDFDMEKVIDKMRELRNKRDLEILDNQMKSINLDTDYQKELPQDKVLDVKYIGEINIDGDIKKIFKLLEQKENGKKELVQIERYYTEDGMFLGGNNLSDSYKEIILSENMKQRDKILEQLEQIENNEILDLNEIEQERLAEIAKALGIEKEDIKRVDEINLETKEKENEKDKDEEEKEISEEQIDGLNIKEEVSADISLKGESLGKKLGLDQKGITNVEKIARVSASSLNKITGETNNNIDAFVAIKTDGTAVPLGEDILKPDTRSGTDPRGKDTTINNDGSVDKEAITTSYLIVNGNGQEYLQCGYDENFGKEIKYTLRSNQDGRDVAIELETQATYFQDSDVREFLNDRHEGIYEPDEILERDEEHGECEEKDVTNIDDDLSNDTHTHFNNEIISECVVEILDTKVNDDDEQIADYRNRDDAKWEIQEALKERTFKSKEELVEYVSQKMKQDVVENADREHDSQSSGRI